MDNETFLDLVTQSGLMVTSGALTGITNSDGAHTIVITGDPGHSCTWNIDKYPGDTSPSAIANRMQMLLRGTQDCVRNFSVRQEVRR